MKKLHYMYSKTFQKYFCFNFDDLSLQLMKVKNIVSQNIRKITFEFQ